MNQTLQPLQNQLTQKYRRLHTVELCGGFSQSKLNIVERKVDALVTDVLGIVVHSQTPWIKLINALPDELKTECEQHKMNSGSSGLAAVPLWGGKFGRCIANSCPVGSGTKVLASDTSDNFNVWAILGRNTIDAPLGDRVVTTYFMALGIKAAHQLGFALDASDSPVKCGLLGGVDV